MNAALFVCSQAVRRWTIKTFFKKIVHNKNHTPACNLINPPPTAISSIGQAIKPSPRYKLINQASFLQRLSIDRKSEKG